MKENKKKLGKNAEIELDESGVEQVSGGGGWSLSGLANKAKDGLNSFSQTVSNTANAVNGVIQTGSDLVNTVQTGVDAVSDAGRQAVTDVANTAKGF